MPQMFPVFMLPLMLSVMIIWGICLIRTFWKQLALAPNIGAEQKSAYHQFSQVW